MDYREVSDITDAEYTALIRSMVRSLRAVNDEVTRLALADLIDERRGPDAHNRTTSKLRSGKMVLASIDVRAIQQMTASPAWCEQLLEFCNASLGWVMDPDTYVDMWRWIHDHVTHFTTEVVEEAMMVAALTTRPPLPKTPDHD